MSTVVNVKGISTQTPEKEVRDFFSFCGKIASLDLKTEGETQSATVTFEKETAAKTALLLDNTQLGPAQVHVKSAASLSELAGDHEGHEDHIAQEDKPRSRIVAEYLAHGYVIGDKVIERALALDQQHGFSSKFTKTLTDFDSKYGAVDKAKAADEKYGVTRSATSAWNSLNSYFESAVNTPSGQKLRQFYEVGNKQVLDVHNEARHLANLKQGKNSQPADEASSSAPVDASASEKILVDEKA